MARFNNPILDRYESNLKTVLTMRESDSGELIPPRNWKTRNYATPYYPIPQHTSSRRVDYSNGFLTRDNLALSDFTVAFRVKPNTYQTSGYSPYLSLKIGGAWIHFSYHDILNGFRYVDNSGSPIGGYWITANSSITPGTFFPIVLRRTGSTYDAKVGDASLSFTAGGSISGNLSDVGLYQTFSANSDMTLGPVYVWDTYLDTQAVSALLTHIALPTVDPLNYVFDDIGFIFGYEVQETLVHDVHQTGQQQSRSLRRKKNERARREFLITNGLIPSCEYESYFSGNGTDHNVKLWTPPGETEPLEVLVDTSSISATYVSNRVVQASLTLREV